MKLIDLFLFGPPILLGIGGWVVVWYTKRESRIRREHHIRQEAAE